MSQWDPGEYGRVNSLQELVARRAIAGLNVRGDERVLDVGCGDGRVTALVVDRLSTGSLFGVDPSEAMVLAARDRFADAERVEFAVGTGATLPHRDEFDLVTSFNALHWELRWSEALDRMAASLRSPGHAFLVFVCGGERPSVEDVVMTTAATPRWQSYFAGFGAPFVHVPPDDYAAAARAARFEVDQIEVADLTWEFDDRAGFVAWLTAGTPAWTSLLPETERPAFIEDAITAYEQVTGSDSTLRFLQCRVRLSR